MAGILRRNLKPEMRSLIEGVVKSVGSTASRKQIMGFATTNGLTFDWWLFNYPFKSFKVQRGLYDLQAILNADDELSRPETQESTNLSDEATV